jgi:F420H(2)-dependent quinone reductase
MKIPEPVFALINPCIGIILRSPLHAVLSSTLMLITFTGRKSQRVFTTPVRYLCVDDSIHCFTSTDTKWWRNLRGGAEVILKIRGEDIRCLANVIENDPSTVKEALKHFLSIFPQDAAYQDIRTNNDRGLVIADLETASTHAIFIVSTPINC